MNELRHVFLETVCIISHIIKPSHFLFYLAKYFESLLDIKVIFLSEQFLYGNITSLNFDNVKIHSLQGVFKKTSFSEKKQVWTMLIQLSQGRRLQ